MLAFCHHAGLDSYLGGGAKPRYIHIAGTNGKGSTTAFVESLLHAGGFKTGAFYSPYVRNYRERIQSDGRPISELDLAESVSKLLPLIDTFGESEFGGITKFEFEAALGFSYWGSVGCEWVALEVGLGGRLDATNVVHPACSVIVSIGLDHTAILGDTLKQIAIEKAGIIKPKTPVVVGAMAPQALAAIGAKAAEMDAPIWRFGLEILLLDQGDTFDVQTPAKTHRGLKPGLTGQWQPHNLALALASLDACGLDLPEDKLRTQAAATYAPGRFERVVHQGVQFVVDGAHNAAAAKPLLATLDKEFAGRGPRVLLANTLAGHDAEAFYHELQGHFDAVLIAPIDSVRALSAEDAREVALKFFPDARATPDLETAIYAAATRASESGLVVVAGSNYLAGETLNLIAEQ